MNFNSQFKLSFDGRISYQHPNSTFTHGSTALNGIDNQIVAIGSSRFKVTIVEITSFSRLRK